MLVGRSGKLDSEWFHFARQQISGKLSLSAPIKMEKIVLSMLQSIKEMGPTSRVLLFNNNM